MHLADVEIRRYEMENVSQALRDMRHDRQLKQTEIPGLSERHVRRLEKEETRLTVDAASKFASALELTLSEFLDELSERITALREDGMTKATPWLPRSTTPTSSPAIRSRRSSNGTAAGSPEPRWG